MPRIPPIAAKADLASEHQHVFDQVRKLDPRNASLRDTLQRLEP